jgi:hypothetical protein
MAAPVSSAPAPAAQVATLVIASLGARKGRKGVVPEAYLTRIGRISDPRRPFPGPGPPKPGSGGWRRVVGQLTWEAGYRAGRIGPGRFGPRGKGKSVCCQAGRGTSSVRKPREGIQPVRSWMTQGSGAILGHGPGAPPGARYLVGDTATATVFVFSAWKIALLSPCRQPEEAGRLPTLPRGRVFPVP